MTEILAETGLQSSARRLRQRLSRSCEYVVHYGGRLQTGITAGRKPLQRNSFYAALRTLLFGTAPA
jgi:hypothetical protein